jgi:putative transcriptional regulator
MRRKAEERLKRTPRHVDVRAIRKRSGLTQKIFARRFGFSVATLRHWERGDRKPRGPALVLLSVLAHNPGAVARALIAKWEDD